METTENELVKAAAFFVNSTGSHIFLTGKAGTGKTTFLKNLALSTHKSFVIVAPTGIAALNAGGVTIHSQFQLPLGTFLPDRTPSGNFNSDNSIYTQFTLTRKHPISSVRKQVLRSIELLIIDEVSMLRADVLDAIDYRMRSVKGNFHQSFGGVQVLMIGDLYQLPPIVKDHEMNYLKRYYHSPHFFEAKALEKDGFVFIELEKIFRQSDNVFISLLNNLRNNTTSDKDIELLNSYYRPVDQEKSDDDVITITTHNYKADEMNKNALNRITEPSFIFQAEIEDDFPENIYPIPEKLELKKGAQVMFVKNDVSGNNRYFNGLLAKVVDVSFGKVVVELSGTKEIYQLDRVTWENKKYTVNSSSKELDEDIVGTFEQYPVKLAWAVTVHKCQGLTFDKAVIDVGQAFAPGQVYVALSRLRSLDGLVLRTKIEPRVISSDSLVVQFSAKKNMQDSLDGLLKEKQREYINQLFIATYDFGIVIKEINYFNSKNDSKLEFEDASMRSAIQLLKEAFETENENTKKFRYQLLNLLQNNDMESLMERMEKGSVYYQKLLTNNIKLLLEHIVKVKKFAGQKTYLAGLAELDQLLMKRLDSVEKSALLVCAIIKNEEWNGSKELHTKRDAERRQWLSQAGSAMTDSPETTVNKSGRVRKDKKNSGVKKEKVDTVQESIRLFREGKNIAEIAESRSLVVGTIEGHFAKAMEKGKIGLKEWISDEELSEISKALVGHTDPSFADVFKKFNGKHSYGKLRAVATHNSANALSAE